MLLKRDPGINMHLYSVVFNCPICHGLLLMQYTFNSLYQIDLTTIIRATQFLKDCSPPQKKRVWSEVGMYLKCMGRNHSSLIQIIVMKYLVLASWRKWKVSTSYYVCYQALLWAKSILKSILVQNGFQTLLAASDWLPVYLASNQLNNEAVHIFPNMASHWLLYIYQSMGYHIHKWMLTDGILLYMWNMGCLQIDYYLF